MPILHCPLFTYSSNNLKSIYFPTVAYCFDSPVGRANRHAAKLDLLSHPVIFFKCWQIKWSGQNKSINMMYNIRQTNTSAYFVPQPLGDKILVASGNTGSDGFSIQNQSRL